MQLFAGLDSIDISRSFRISVKEVEVLNYPANTQVGYFTQVHEIKRNVSRIN